MINKDKKDFASEILCKKAQELGRVPLKSDFDPVTISKIKAYLGPWPRALEYAGLKEEKEKKAKKRRKGTKKTLPKE